MVGGYAHAALFYRGGDDLLDKTVPFVRAGVDANEAVLVVMSRAKNDAMRDALGTHADGVTFADMGHVGKNPARIIPAWRWFVDAHSSTGRPMRGIGEPITPDLAGATLNECHRHEALLNVAFPEDPPLQLLCPYDTSALDPDVIDEARRTHPLLHSERYCTSGDYAPVDAREPFSAPLSAPPASFDELLFGVGPLHTVRRFVQVGASGTGLAEGRVADLVLAVNEVATNSLQHAGGRGRVRMWREPGTLVCEVSDDGLIDEPLVGRRWPPQDGESGRGLWMANQVCDLVQVHSTAAGTSVRLHMKL